MKELQNQLKAKTLILTHGDSDGICSGAIAKSAYPEAYIIICDMAIEERHYSELHSTLEEFAEECNLYYIDHHPLPERWKKEAWF